MRTLNRNNRIEHYFGDMLDAKAIARVKRAVAAERKKPTKREVNEAVKDVMQEMGITRTTLMYGQNRGEDARYV